MKHQQIGLVGAQAPAANAARPENLASEVLNIMEQGVLVWSPEGVCELHNTRIFNLLELEGDDLRIGMTREEFRARAVARGELSRENEERSAGLIRAAQPYCFDRVLPSGRVVLTNGRPTRGGGYVVTFTDVTDARRAAADLDLAKRGAEEAEARAKQVLAGERQRQNEARMLAELDEWLQSCKSLDELFVIVTRFMDKLLPHSKGELYIYSNSRDALDGMCKWNTRDLHTSIQSDSCWALRRGRSYEYNSDTICFQCEHVEAHQHGVEIEEYICVPIIAHGDTVGLLHIRFDRRCEEAAHITGSAQFAIRCGEHISMAIANVKLRDELHDQSIRDPLTGLYNRRYFVDALRREISIGARNSGSFGLISVDADRFKAFNDNHGHDAGDTVLRALGDKLREQLVAGQVACRMGGEEFAVLVPGADSAQTMALAEHLRQEVSKMQMSYMGSKLPCVTISSGCAVWPMQGATPQLLLRNADKALYLAKEEGRNCVRSAEAGAAAAAAPGPG